MPVAIVGMHRSGTSLVAQMLHRSGLFLGSEDWLLGPSYDNPQGFWEHTRFQRINEVVLEELGGGWETPPMVPAGWAEDPRLTDHVAAARKLLHEFAGREPWGWKDPRTCLTLPLWQELIPGLKVIICLRNPLEVAVSLRRRNLFSYSKSIRLWHLYNERVLDARASDCIVVPYERVVSAAQGELARVLDFLGMAADVGLLRDAASVCRDDLRHIRFDMSDLRAVRCHPEIVEFYTRLRAGAGRGANVPVRAALPEPLDRIVDERALAALVAVRSVESAVDGSQRDGHPARPPSTARTDRSLSGRGPAAILAASMHLGGSELVTGGNRPAGVLTPEDLKNALRGHLAEGLRVVLDEHSDYRDLLGEGLIDSMAVMELVAYIEEAFGVIVEDEEIIADNFRSLSSMVWYVAGKRTGADSSSPYVASVREFVAQATPAGSVVALLTSGDDDLLQIPDRVVWPFPCDEKGVWMPGHPADGAEAIAMVRRVQELGARHIVFLGPELWWLDHYQGLRSHLERDGGPTGQSTLGVAYALSDGR